MQSIGCFEGSMVSMEDPEGILNWFNGEYHKALEGVRVALFKVGLQKALSGNFHFWKV